MCVFVYVCRCGCVCMCVGVDVGVGARDWLLGRQRNLSAQVLFFCLSEASTSVVASNG